MPTVLAVVVLVRLFNISSAPPAIVEEAQRIFSRIYAAIDVDIDWTDGSSTLLLIVRDEEPGDLRRASQPILGAALHTPNGSQVAYVFYRRVAEQADWHAVAAAAVLASAMAHEVGHLLLPTPDHARDGLMRACWDYAEFLRAANGQLRFSAGEGALIRDGALATPRPRQTAAPR
jgi:hypothetical protein